MKTIPNYSLLHFQNLLPHPIPYHVRRNFHGLKNPLLKYTQMPLSSLSKSESSSVSTSARSLRKGCISSAYEVGIVSCEQQVNTSIWKVQQRNDFISGVK
ncbi:hypothetical protein AVEN_81163-1 [Araneus ventricosus]|uniref:Uncharacterized protein n=1 Tax=Araneus ventricosus TaxID=182803 RepID=A0A4Y2USK8_ARAVE|nr:hypothetical protein AVEN_81163-1 [Araneus ventricosus]